MIQETGANCIDTTFDRSQPKDSDYVLLTERSDIFILENGEMPTVSDWKAIGGAEAALLHVFAIGGHDFFLVLDWSDDLKAKLRRESNRYLREIAPEWLRLGMVTALHLNTWHQTHRYCGCCGGKMEPDSKELAMRCTSCNSVTYPTVFPAIIVGIINGDKILLTKSSVYKHPVYALVSGYLDVGETMEECVAREAMEETGLKIKNIRYYDNQPWGFSGAQMIGYWAELDGDDDVTIQKSELKEATWFTPEEMPETPDPIDLTHHMMELFRNRKLPSQRKKQHSRQMV